MQLDLRVLGTGLARVFAAAEDDKSFADVLARLDRVSRHPLENR
jgi:hypothetical protein